MAKKVSSKKPRGRAPSDQTDVVHSSVYLSRPMWRAIREVAVGSDRKAHDVMIEGIQMVLRRYGKSAS